jgi:lysophospholipase L1-like esterase
MVDAPRNKSDIDIGAVARPGNDRSARRRWLFRAMMLLAPLVLLLVVETGLRVAGRGGYPPLVLHLGPAGSATLCMTNGACPPTYFSGARANAGSLHEVAFLSPKPARTVRIVLAGESAIKGFPQPPGLAVPAFLEDMLRQAWPGRPVEVIDIGATGVASFAVAEMVQQMLAYAPDLVVLYVGNNEFYGAGGVASARSLGRSSSALRARRWLGSLAMVQALRGPSGAGAPAAEHLMESAARSMVGPDDSARAAAVTNLTTHVRGMVRQCRNAGVAVMVCTLACNERDLAPIGRWRDGNEIAAQQVDALLAEARTLASDSEVAESKLRAALAIAPRDAYVHYLLGKSRLARGFSADAPRHFRDAVDLDAMPWRATSRTNDALRAVAHEEGVPLCDVREYFRKRSPLQCAGNELFDDHVHFSLGGQWLMAQAIVETLSNSEGSLRVAPEALQQLPGFQDAAGALGANGYEAFAVAHQMAILFDIPFMRASNPDQLARFVKLREEYLGQMPPALRSIAEAWTKPPPAGATRRSLSALVAQQLAAGQRPAEALPLWRLAARSDPPLSAWYFEDIFEWLAGRKRLNGALEDAERALALQALDRVKLLAAVRPAPAALEYLWSGKFHHLLGEHAVAATELERARGQFDGGERAQADMALVECYINLGKRPDAVRVIDEGVRRGGPLAAFYEKIRTALPPE